MEPVSYLDNPAYAFFPVHAYDPSPGCYLQLIRGKGAPSKLCRADDLLYMRARLGLRLARRLAGGDSATALAQMAVRPGTTFETARHRWPQFMKCLRSFSLSERSNSIFRACMRDLAGLNHTVDLLIDDRSLVWQLAASANYSFGELDGHRTVLERGDMVVPPVMNMNIIDGRKGWEFLLPMLADNPCGMEGWRLVNVLFFCLARAQSRGDVFEYAHAHLLMVIAMRLATMARHPSIERLIWKDFWQEFGSFLADWYSRIRLVGDSFFDIATVSHELADAGYWVAGQTLFSDPPAGESYSGPHKPCGRSRSPRRNTFLYFGDFSGPARYIRRHPEELKKSWPSVTEGLMFLGFDPNPLMKFDGYIRRERDPRRQVQMNAKGNVRGNVRRQCERLRRGAGSRLKRKTRARFRTGLAWCRPPLLVRKALLKSCRRRSFSPHRAWRERRRWSFVCTTISFRSPFDRVPARLRRAIVASCSKRWPRSAGQFSDIFKWRVGLPIGP
jgi:hypothetical protein